ncbi:23S rRNA (adenine(2030)-N(6))-methyltransferase RlmJ [Beijerinckia indica]|uniref:Ribosomal RNA large subunit methyltransferase J n=1 Tax=Beijerinckia indica subsp. indica (strain ATCC 9039 / DSM 1715 / NCIMB 8712) TaxID=395963 RepID=B2IGC6_BEII9|nr:23S rRNA (adenine(2030)-N(6))-methyltransferase RlmJ [Beijerinckia indica]ACB94311.1 protein of unknown function DUF519 [Beijerinckia indica subsp. indica ATCC 9039]
MNYRHDFHAGNFADVFKHIILARALTYLGRKPKPYRVIDTHAGSGLYGLADVRAEKTGEWRQGIGRLLAADLSGDLAALLAPYLAIVAPLVKADPPTYPGSPLIARQLMRREDRLQCCELEPSAALRLKTNCGEDARFRFAAIDAYTGLKAYIPPVERRGLVLIDPPFEKPDEFETLAKALVEAWQKWSSGIYLVWYPVKEPRRVDHFVAALRDAGIKRLLRLELQVAPLAPQGPLVRNGLLVINPPFGLDEEARIILPALASLLSDGQGGTSMVEWVSGE